MFDIHERRNYENHLDGQALQVTHCWTHFKCESTHENVL